MIKRYYLFINTRLWDGKVNTNTVVNDGQQGFNLQLQLLGVICKALF